MPAVRVRPRLIHGEIASPARMRITTGTAVEMTGMIPKKPWRLVSMQRTWGFFDMHGNVREWTAVWNQTAYPTGNPVIDPTGPTSGTRRIRRGGSWFDQEEGLRSAKRSSSSPGDRINDLGFRVSLQKSQ